MTMTIPLALPDISDLEISLVMEVLKSDRLSMGPMTDRFEQLVAEFAGTKYACALSSGTAALHLALLAHKIGPGDEVIVPSFTFIASANVVLMVGAKVVFVEIDPHTWNMDPAAVEAAITPRTKAIMPVHVFGQPCRMDRLMAIAEKHHLAVIEDSCEALGAKFQGRPAGSIGSFGSFAFYPNKQITTGEGGILVSNDETLIGLAKSYRNQGRGAASTWLEHVRLGYNYRMCELQAALGVGQMQRVNEIIGKRTKVAEMYLERLKGFDRLITQKIDSDVTMSWFVFVVRLTDNFTQAHRDDLLAKLRAENIGCNPYFTPVHEQQFYREDYGWKKGMLPITERIGERSLAVPFHTKMTDAMVDQVCSRLKAIVSAF
jgi:perosamine synthetase